MRRKQLSRQRCARPLQRFNTARSPRGVGVWPPDAATCHEPVAQSTAIGLLSVSTVRNLVSLLGAAMVAGQKRFGRTYCAHWSCGTTTRQMRSSVSRKTWRLRPLICLCASIPRYSRRGASLTRLRCRPGPARVITGCAPAGPRGLYLCWEPLQESAVCRAK
jgi:hypothetical protein